MPGIQHTQQYKIAVVASVLTDHPDGVSAAALVELTGLRPGVVGQALAAMLIGGAVTRDLVDDPAGEVWVLTGQDWRTITLDMAKQKLNCPTCHRPVPTRVSVSAPGSRRNGTTTVLGKNELRVQVVKFLDEHPGTMFTASKVAKELDRSAGAVGNALTRAVLAGQAHQVGEAPATYTSTHTDQNTPA